MRRTWMLSVVGACALLSAPALQAEGMAAHVTKLDMPAKCLSVEWNNDTEKIICWNDKTKFSILDTGKAAKATDMRVGSYLRMEGEDEGEGEAARYRASEVVIWLAQSRPAKP